MTLQELTTEQIKRKRIVYLGFSTFTLLILGLIYAWSIFAAPIGKTYVEYGPMLPQVFQVSMFAFCVSALLGAQIIKKFSAKAAIIIAALLMAVGFICTALASGISIWMLFFFYGIIAGSGCGIGYNAIIALVNPWFPDMIGRASGVQMMGFGISSLVFGSLANALFGVMDWTYVFFIIAAAAFVIMVLLALFVKPAPKEVGAKLGIEASTAEAKISPTKQQPIHKTKVFWIYSVWATFLLPCGLALIGTASQGAQIVGFDAGFGALLVGLVSTMNGVGRIVNGTIFDKAGLLPVMVLSSVIAIACSVSLASALAFNVGPLYIVAAILIAMPYGSVPVMASAFSRQRYVPATFAWNLGLANCNIATAAVVNIIISAVVGSPASTSGPLVYAILAVLAVVALLSTVAFRRVYQADLAAIRKELAD